jgi:hypothetical protein
VANSDPEDTSSGGDNAARYRSARPEIRIRIRQ